MTRATIAVVVLGLTVAAASAFTFDLDARAIVYLALMVFIGAIAIGVARRSDRRTVGPATCSNCGGLISPNAPYCKHCGAAVRPDDV